MGTMYREMGRVAEAIGCYKAAIALEPRHAVAMGNLGSCLLDQGQVDLALQTLQHALRLQPPHADVLHADVLSNYGNALHEKGRLDEAIASYRRALHLRPDHAHGGWGGVCV
jgi:tetratricopeptide (TPR) repeat protein